MESYSEVRTILKALCAAKGTSGNEKDAADAAAKMLEKYMPVRRNALGSVCGSIGSSGTHILLDAHIDQIGLIVTAIDDEGFLKVTKCGGVDIRMLAAAEVTVHGKRIFTVLSFQRPRIFPLRRIKARQEVLKKPPLI